MNAFSKMLYAALASLALLLHGCSGMPPGIDPPTVVLSDFGIAGGSFFEQQFNLKLRVQNPNDQEIRIDGVAFTLEVNDAPFANGVGNQMVTVGRFASATVAVDGYSSTGGLIRQAGRFMQGGDRALRYRLKGTLNMAGGLRVPFDRSGEFDFWLFAPK